ncbi:hypothetical protein SASPL_155414 [Salvia splendens]|uniref:Uncharacterized protein n=1 Tax=Salvia splendens TaxID=180675 RepID=A0A8X8W1V1_SALSN|nr:hypothetical protein SASPL_155414 [Salvia splendens]
MSFQAISDLNIYDILESCYHAPTSFIQLKNTNVPLSFRRLGETERSLLDEEVTDVWLNNEAVRKALHADSISHDAGSMIKYHQNLTSRGYLEIMICVSRLPELKLGQDGSDTRLLVSVCERPS